MFFIWLISVNDHSENIRTHYSQVRLYVYTHICAKRITYKVTYGAVREPLFLTWACQIALYLISHHRGYYLQWFFCCSNNVEKQTYSLFISNSNLSFSTSTFFQTWEKIWLVTPLCNYLNLTGSCRQRFETDWRRRCHGGNS